MRTGTRTTLNSPNVAHRLVPAARVVRRPLNNCGARPERIVEYDVSRRAERK